MATLEFIRPVGNFPNQLRYTNDLGVGILPNRTSSDFIRQELSGQTVNTAPRERTISVDTINKIDLLTNIPNSLVDENTVFQIQIHYINEELIIPGTKDDHDKIRAFCFGGDNNKIVDTLTITEESLGN